MERVEEHASRMKSRADERASGRLTTRPANFHVRKEAVARRKTGARPEGGGGGSARGRDRSRGRLAVRLASHDSNCNSESKTRPAGWSSSCASSLASSTITQRRSWQ